MSSRSGYDPTMSTVSSTAPTQLGLASELNAEAAKAVPVGNTSIVMYTFGSGPMGISLEDAQGGTRVVISEIADKSQAERLGVPIGGTLMRVAGRTATGKRRAEVGKWLATAERPLTLQILHPGGAAAVHARVAAIAEAEDPFAVPYKAPLDTPADSKHPAAKLGPISSHTFDKPGSLGFKELSDIDEGVVITSLGTNSAAATLGVPVGGIIIGVNGDDAKLQKDKLSKQMSTASRPLTLLVVAASSNFIANAMAQREARPNPETQGAGSAVQPYTFEQPSLGLTLEEVEGGSGGVFVSHVSGAAAALGVPTGGTLVRIGTIGVAGLSKQAIAKVIAKAGRPMTMYIRKGDAAKEAAAKLAEAAAPATAAAGPANEEVAPEKEKKGKKTSRASSKAKKTKRDKADAKATSREENATDSPTKGKKTRRGGIDKSEWPRPADPVEVPDTRKFTFGEGPLGLGLADGPNGKGVIVTEVVPGSAAAQLGVEPNVHVLALNGSDVTGHVKLSLGKMIGYLPRPLTVTMSLPMTVPDAAAPAPAATEDVSAVAVGVPAVVSAEDGDVPRPVKPKKKKTARHSKKGKSPRAKPLADEAIEAPPEVLDASEAPPAAPIEEAVAEAGAVEAALAPGPAPPAETTAEQPEPDGEDEASDVEAGEEEISDRGAESTAADEASPTGGSTDAEEGLVTDQVTDEPEVPIPPRRAHPIPRAPVEAFPEWSKMPPPRSPRQVSGAGAKYDIKNTQEAFSHMSLTDPAAYTRKQTRRMSTVQPGLPHEEGAGDHRPQRASAESLVESNLS